MGTDKVTENKQIKVLIEERESEEEAVFEHCLCGLDGGN